MSNTATFRRSVLGIVLAGLLAAAVGGSGPQPSAAKPPAAASLAWEVASDGQAVTIRPQVAGPYTLVRQAWSDDEYRLIVAVGGSASEPPAVYVVPLAIGGDGTPTPTPQPGPTPEPKPDPKPLPAPKTLWGIVVGESSARSPQQAVVLASPAVRGLFDRPLRVIDPDDAVDAAMRPYVERAKGQPGCTLFIVDDQGAVYFEGPLPADVAAAQALVARIRKEGRP